ncbi:MAG: hypothetical protein EHM41_03850 [Chloroflexi bacterium]|nr:MAG: hypothetical protein EHM41_03850 [Chloroflexota bacterium]
MNDDVETGEMSRPMMEALLAEPVLARLATADPGECKPHVVPVWFSWDGESIWISSYSKTRKILNLDVNPHCSVLVDTAESGVDFRSILFEGEAELIREPLEFLVEVTTQIYSRYLGEEGVRKERPQSWIHDPQNLLVKLTPSRIVTWYSASAQPVKDY